MSRVGQVPIPVSSDMQVQISGNNVMVKGPKGELSRSFPSEVSVELKDNQLVVTRPSDEKRRRAMHGLVRSLLANMVEGVTKGFQKELDIVGGGYRARKDGDRLILQIGFSHMVEMTPPLGIIYEVEGTNRIKIVGIDKEVVGEAAANIRGVRPPDAYKGKGIRYAGEKIHLKPGKKGVGRKK